MLAGGANAINEMVVYRFMQGIFGAALVPLSMHILLDVYPREEHGTAISWWSMGVMFSAIAGPTLGGFLTEFLSLALELLCEHSVGNTRICAHLFFCARKLGRQKTAFRLVWLCPANLMPWSYAVDAGPWQ